MIRHDGRSDDALREVGLIPDYLKNPLASVLINMGDTKVLCTANQESKTPHFLKDTGEGWVTAEYCMIPGATDTRTRREVTRGRASGRTMEIQRLIGRALRSVIDRKALGERSLWIDCEVLQADGGTRTASITGGFTVLCLALHKLREQGLIERPVLSGLVAAISVGMVDGRPLLDLDYTEDSTAEVDMNIVRTDDGRYIELQGTAESQPFGRQQLDEMLALADKGIDKLQLIQRKLLDPFLGGLLIER